MTYRSASARAVAFDDALREAMSAAVTDAIQPEHSSASDPAAGTPRTERISTEDVAALARIMDADSATDNDDRVEHTRKARLRRWQETRE